MADRVVLAYSGGLDTSVAVRWLIEHEGVEVVAVAVDVGQAADRGGEDWDAVRERALAAGAVEAVVIDAAPRDGRALLHAGAGGERTLRGQVPARVRAVAARHRAAPGGRGAPARGDRGRARLHRQGQRPGALRGRRARAGAGPRDLRAGAGVGADARGLHRAGRQVGDPHHGDQGEAVLDRRQPVGQGDRVRRDRGPVGPTARRRLHAHPGHRDRAGRGHRRLRVRRAGVVGRRGALALRPHRAARRGRREPRLRPPRHGREPPRRHQEPRDLRMPGRAGADPCARGFGGPDARARPAPREGAPRAALGRAGLRRVVVLAATRRAAGLHRREPAPRDGRGAAALRRAGHLHRRRPAQPGRAVRPRPGHLRRVRHLPAPRRRGLRAAVGTWVWPRGRPARARARTAGPVRIRHRRHRRHRSSEGGGR